MKKVFNSNPAVESWGHFPNERQRLYNLLHKHQPKGLFFLSGDVHLGVYFSAGPALPPIEITSSGLTHDCSDGGIPMWLCQLSWKSSESEATPFLFEKNFGSVQLDWKSRQVVVSVHRVKDGTPVLNVSRSMEAKLPLPDEYASVSGPIPSFKRVFCTWMLILSFLVLAYKSCSTPSEEQEVRRKKRKVVVCCMPHTSHHFFPMIFDEIYLLFFKILLCL